MLQLKKQIVFEDELSKAKITLGEANISYISKRYAESKNLLKKAISIDPSLSDSWITMAINYEALDDHNKVVNFYMIGALINPESIKLWYLLAIKTFNQRLFKEAIDCFDHIIIKDRANINPRFQRAMLLWEMGCRNIAITSIKKINFTNEYTNFEFRFIKTLARWYYKIGKSKSTIKLLSNYLELKPTICNFSVIKTLSEVLIEKRLYQKSNDLITEAVICKEKLGLSEWQFINIKIKTCICAIKLGLFELNEHLMTLKDHKIEHVGDLLIDIVRAYTTSNQYSKSMEFLKPIIGCPMWSYTLLLLKKSNCFEILCDYNQSQEINHLFLINMNKNSRSIRILLSKLCGFYKTEESEFFASITLNCLQNNEFWSILRKLFPLVDGVTTQILENCAPNKHNIRSERSWSQEKIRELLFGLNNLNYNLHSIDKITDEEVVINYIPYFAVSICRKSILKRISRLIPLDKDKASLFVQFLCSLKQSDIFLSFCYNKPWYFPFTLGKASDLFEDERMISHGITIELIKSNFRKRVSSESKYKMTDPNTPGINGYIFPPPDQTSKVFFLRSTVETIETPLLRNNFEIYSRINWKTYSWFSSINDFEHIVNKKPRERKLSQENFDKDLKLARCLNLILRRGFNARRFYLRGLQLLRLHDTFAHSVSLLISYFFTIKNDYDAALGEFFVTCNAINNEIVATKEKKKKIIRILELLTFKKIRLLFLQSLVQLCIAISYFNNSDTMVQRGQNGHVMALNSIIWIGKYLKTRGMILSIEARYNTGRLAHAIGVEKIAKFYYWNSLHVSDLHSNQRLQCVKRRVKENLYFFKKMEINYAETECECNILNLCRNNLNINNL